jgi:hypothetical protein
LQTLVKYAHSQTAESVRSACQAVASDPHFSLADLFELLDVSQQTRTFYLTRTKASVQTTFDLARTQTEALNTNDPFRAISLELINERAADHDPVQIAKTIREKFKEGGYGQFTREFIDEYAPELSEEDKERLTIGWVAPATAELDYGGFGDDFGDDMVIDDDDELLV